MKNTTHILSGFITINSKDGKHSYNIDSGEYHHLSNNGKFHQEFRVHSTNGYDSLNSDRKILSLIEAIKHAEYRIGIDELEN